MQGAAGPAAVWMAACVFKQRLEKPEHHRSAADLVSPQHFLAAEQPTPDVRRQTSFDLGCRKSCCRTAMGGCRTARVRLVQDGCVQVCREVHGNTFVSKLLNTKYLRRWETHYLQVADEGLFPRTRQGYMEAPVLYSEILDLHSVASWEVANKFYLRLVLRSGQLLLQLCSATARDQWYQSILWKRRMSRHRTALRDCTKPESIVREIKAMIDACNVVPLLDESICQTPLDIVSGLLAKHRLWQDRLLREELLVAMTSLLEQHQPSKEVCEFFSRFCRDCPRSVLVQMKVAPVVERILKHNVDFSKFLHSRRLVQDFFLALCSQGSGDQATTSLIQSLHGTGSACPHPRVLPNLVAACLGAIFLLQEVKRKPQGTIADALADSQTQAQERIHLFLGLLASVSEYGDWRPGLAMLLQPIPFPDGAFAESDFMQSVVPVLQRIAVDPRCEVHKVVLGSRDNKDGWLDVVRPSSPTCPDDGQFWTVMLKTLLGCCCRRKVFLKSLLRSLGDCQLMSLRGDATCQDILCQMLEWRLIDDSQQQHVTVSTLVSTPTGEASYRALCDRMIQLRELQSKGGPRVLSLPSRSTDDDLTQLLGTGCFGNLETLSLAFTAVTSQCAHQLIKLPNLRCLNLWCTQFGDEGLMLITEHLHKLQQLNLCETYVTNQSLPSLSALKELHTLNLNSTDLSATTLSKLRGQLPLLHSLDVRYTDAW